MRCAGQAPYRRRPVNSALGLTNTLQMCAYDQMSPQRPPAQRQHEVRYLIPSAWLAILLMPVCVQASDPPYLRDAQLSWAAFECSALAQSAGDDIEHRRLGTLGIERGRFFLTSVRKARIPTEKLETTLPSGMSASLRMESIDLVIGSYSRAAQEFAITRMRTDEKEALKRFSESTKAASHFQYRNCHLLK